MRRDVKDPVEKIIDQLVEDKTNELQGKIVIESLFNFGRLADEFCARYSSVLLPHAEWAIKMFIKFIDAKNSSDPKILANLDDEIAE